MMESDLIESKIDGNKSCCEGCKVRMCRNHLAAPIWPLGDIPVTHGALIHEKHYFSYFLWNRNCPTLVSCR